MLEVEATTLTEEGMDALGAVVQADCEPDDYDAFVKAVFEEIEAEQCVKEWTQSVILT